MDEAEQVLRMRAKKLMRQRFRGQRMGVPASAIAGRSAALAERLLAHEAIERAASVALFWPIERYKEVDLRAVDAALRARSVRVAYPHIDPETRVMTFRAVDRLEAMVPSPLGFMGPAEDAQELAALDVVVVPGLAFDERGFRIGYGAGFYDRTLPRYCPPGISIGVGFDFQLAIDLPESEADVPVQHIVTDARTLATRGR